MIMHLSTGKFSYLVLPKLSHSKEATQLLGRCILVLRKGELRVLGTGANAGAMFKLVKAVLPSICLAFFRYTGGQQA